MPYSTLTDIQNAITAASVIQLTDDTGAGTVDQGKVDAAVLAADELINGYLRSRYTLPLASTPPLIKDLSVSIAVYRLYDRRFAANMPDSIKAKYDNALRLLGMIQKGTISLGIESTTQVEGTFKTNKTSDDKTFSKDILDQY
jgi:phage gp36-like protein